MCKQLQQRVVTNGGKSVPKAAKSWQKCAKNCQKIGVLEAEIILNFGRLRSVSRDIVGSFFLRSAGVSPAAASPRWRSPRLGGF